MKWDIKVFIIFILTVLGFGGSFILTHGKFAFPLNYVDLGIGLLSIFFLFTTPVSQYSPLLAAFGGSLIYLLFGYEGYADTIPGEFRLVRNYAILAFAIFLLIRVFRKKDTDYRGIFLFFGLLVLMQMIFNGINFSKDTIDIIDFIKLIIAFILCLIVFKGTRDGKELHLGIKRFFIVLALYLFRCIFFILDKNDWV